MAKLDFSTISVLIIEDEPHTRSIIKQIVSHLGVRDIHEAEDGKSGFLETVRVRPTIVLCDINMEPVNGLVYLGRLRQFKLEAVKNTPVIFLTVEFQVQTVKTARKHAMNGYLIKPVSPSDVETRIRAVLE
jgi:two-component system chemotaxis response regulator CheY